MEEWSELLIDIGLGNRLPDMVAKQIAQLSDKNAVEGKVLGQEALVIRGAEGLLITYSKCCYPIPGDAILGTFTAGHGLVVHVADCPNIVELRKTPERCLMVDWDEDLDSHFHVRIRIKLVHEPGAFAEVATAIAENESNINQVDLHDGSENPRVIDFVIDVKNRAHLAKIIRSIRGQSRVEKVWRKIG